MRFAVVILVLAAIAAGLVHIRRRQAVCCHEIQSLQIRRIALRRKLWDQNVRLGYLTAPHQVRRRVEEMVLNRNRADEQVSLRD